MIAWIKLHTKLFWTLIAVGLPILVLILWELLVPRPAGQPPTAIPDLKNELRAIGAEAEVQKLQAALGAEKAREHVQKEYADHLAALDEEKKKQAAELMADPAKLAAFLVRAGK